MKIPIKVLERQSDEYKYHLYYIIKIAFTWYSFFITASLYAILTILNLEGDVPLKRNITIVFCSVTILAIVVNPLIIIHARRCIKNRDRILEKLQQTAENDMENESIIISEDISCYSVLTKKLFTAVGSALVLSLGIVLSFWLCYLYFLPV